MANIRKSFNLRNGVQIDDDNFIVNPNGLVGIGTTIPEETLDVRGSVKVVGIITASSGLIENLRATRVLNIGVTSITSGIISSSSGITTYYGDGSKLLNLPTSQWLDIDAGLGFTSIYARGFVGVGTVDPRYLFQVGGNNNLANFQGGVGINEKGDIRATGIVTASQFSGSGVGLTNLNASNISSGTLSSDRLPTIPGSKLPNSFQVSGIITATGGFNGVASTALSLSSNARINIKHVETETGITGVSTISTRLNVNGTTNLNGNVDISGNISLDGNANVTGDIDLDGGLNLGGSIGINTDLPQSDIDIVKSSNASLRLFSQDQSILNVLGTNSALISAIGTQSSILVGRSSSPLSNNGGLRFGNTSGLYPYSTSRSLDIINYDRGNLNYYLHYGSSGIGTGNFNWIYGQDQSNPLMSLTYQGNLGVGITNPSNKVEVAGDISAYSLNLSGNLTATEIGSSVSVQTLYVLNGSAGILDSNGNQIINELSNVYVISGISTFFDLDVSNNSTINNLRVSTNGIFDQKIGIGNTNPTAEIHIGDPTFQDVRDTLLITRNGIGIGTDNLENVDANLYALDGTGLFGSIGIGTTTPGNNNFYVDGNSKFVNGDVSVGINTSHGVILTSPNGTRYRLVVSNTGVLSTVAV